MTIDLYYFPPSPPCRAVMLVGKAIGVHFNLKSVNALKGEQMKPEFLQVNPQHTIPTIDDNGLIMWESRAINGYLVDKYAKNDFLYPKDPKERGIVDSRLYFDLTSLFDNIIKCYFPVIFKKTDHPSPERLEALEKAVEALNAFLEKSQFVAGGHLTIADFSIAISVHMLTEIFGFDIGRYDNVASWYKRCKEIMAKYGFEELNAAGGVIGELYRANLQAN